MPADAAESAPVRSAAVNSADFAYAALRKRILSGDLPPGAALKERDLCEELEVSRTPVREALHRLSSEGLAELRPRRSIVVSSFAEEELAEIFEVGIVLESFMAGLAAEKATAEDVRTLEAIVAQMEALLAQDNRGDDLSRRYIALDQAFHAHITATARNTRIAQILKQTMHFRVLDNILGRYRKPDFANSLAQHRTIAQAIAAGDAEWARLAMGSHIRTGRTVERRTARTAAG